MGRPRKPLDATADAKAVRARLKDKDLEGWQRQRLQAAQLGLRRVLSLPQIAQEVGVGARTIGSWFGAMRRGGIEGLLERKPKGKGPASWLGSQTAKEARAELDKGQWRRAQDARRWLEKKLGRKLSLVATYKYLGKCEARLKVPRPRHAKKDPANVEALGLEAGSRVKVWMMDEARFGLHTQLRWVWTRRGQRPVVARQIRYEWDYLYGALSVIGGEAHFAHVPGVSLDWDEGYLRDLGASDAQAIHVLIRDQAGFRLRDGDARLPARVRIIDLPPYSPELNPCEQLWDIINGPLAFNARVCFDQTCLGENILE